MPEFQQIYPQKHQGFAGDSPALLQKGNHNMFRKELVGIETAGFFLGVDGQNTLGPLG
jgi:hypothetical protein